MWRWTWQFSPRAKINNVKLYHLFSTRFWRCTWTHEQAYLEQGDVSNWTLSCVVEWSVSGQMQLDGQSNCSSKVMVPVVRIHLWDVELWCRIGDRRGTPCPRDLSPPMIRVVLGGRLVGGGDATVPCSRVTGCGKLGDKINILKEEIDFMRSTNF